MASKIKLPAEIKKPGYYSYDLYTNQIFKKCNDCGEMFKHTPPTGENCAHTNTTDVSPALVSGCVKVESVVKSGKKESEVTVNSKTLGPLKNYLNHPDNYKVEITEYNGRNIVELRDAIRKIYEVMCNQFSERGTASELLLTTLLASSNIVFYGLPGVAKTMLIEQFMKYIYEPREGFEHYNRALFFNIQMNKFTEKEAVFGSMDFKRLMDFGDPSTSITAESFSILTSTVTCLDEIFKGQGATLNTLLSLANTGERKFVEGKNQFHTGVTSIVSASNEEPDKKGNLSALNDRFVIKYQVNDIAIKSSFLNLMETIMTGDFEKHFDEADRITLQEFKFLTTFITDFSSNMNDETAAAIAGIISDLRDSLRSEDASAEITTRKYVQSIPVIVANYFLKYDSSEDGLTVGEKIKIPPQALTVTAHTLWNELKHSGEIRKTVFRELDPNMLKIEELYQEYRRTQESMRSKLRNQEISPKTPEFKTALGEITAKKTSLENLLQKHIKDAKKEGLADLVFNRYLNQIKQEMLFTQQAMVTSKNIS